MKIMLTENYSNIRYTARFYKKGEVLDVDDCSNSDFYAHTVSAKDGIGLVVNFIKKNICEEVNYER